MLPSEMAAWRKVVQQVVSGIADEETQRRAWFGVGREESSPDEDFNQFFGDAAIEEFLARKDNELNPQQLEAGRRLLEPACRRAEQHAAATAPVWFPVDA